MKRLFALATTMLALVMNSALPMTHPATAQLNAIGHRSPAVRTLPVGLFRTRVSLRHLTSRARLNKLGVVILQEVDGQALVLADDDQLEVLARLGFEPHASDDLAMLASTQGVERAWLAHSLQPLLSKMTALQTIVQREQGAEAQRSADAERVISPEIASARAELRTAIRALTPEQTAGIASLSSVDDDADGLTNTQEQWWCTNPMNPDSDGDGVKDGDEVTAAKDWLANRRAGPPASGKPFAGWPPQIPGCRDDDQDSVPDLAERWELGLNMNRESTDRDKFDDGQELFGNTYCPGSGGYCGYGALPRNEDWGVIFAEMPSWVKAPGNHPLVAAFPVPEVDVVPSSLRMVAVTTVTTDHTISQGTERSYSTSKTEGTSTSVANTVTWNEWQEVSEAISQRVSGSQLSALSTEELLAPQGFGNRAGRFVGGVSKAVLGAGAFAGGTWCGASTQGVGLLLGCAGVAAMGWDLLKSGVGQAWDALSSDEAQEQAKSNTFIQGQSTNVTVDTSVEVVLNNNFDTQGIVNAINGMRYAYNQNGDLIAKRLYDIAYVLAQPVRTTTQTQGRSWGGAQTTTTEQYEEHTITNGEAFSSEESWSTATAVDSAHAADLWFTYKVRNTGTEYAREIANLAFNIYIGDDPNPAYTYFVAPDLGGSGKFQNFMPNEEHIYTSRRIPLNLDQMRAVDLGGPIRIVVEDFTYGIDELFYQDAVNAGVLIALEDGTDDGDEGIDTYLIPTWGTETVLDVLARYFPHTTDADGNLIAIWTPEYRSNTPTWCAEPRRVGATLWCKHALSTADWWNVYTSGLGDGSEGFQDTPAAPGSVALFRFNQDSDLDGYSDRSEERLGTDPHDPASHPKPELIAGVHSVRVGNSVTATLSLLNTGLYDAYGVEAVMIAPDDSVSITNNTVGGSGRVRAQKQVIVGSRILLQSPLPPQWTQPGHAVPAVGGYYTGSADRTYTFTVQCSNPGGCDVGAGSWSLAWNDGAGNSGTLNFGAGYASPTFQNVGSLGVKLALYTGKVYNGESFTVQARTPRDTFQYTINREPYTEPIVIVSYNDPQGNHRFVTPVRLSTPTENLLLHSGKMIHEGAGVEIVTEASFTAGHPMTTTLVAQVPSRLVNAHLFLEFIAPSGLVVREEATTVTLEPGPNIVVIPWTSNDFNPAYDPQQDYVVVAFFTDWQGNILDTAARPLSSFQADPKPALSFDETSTTWDFGTVSQGTLLEHTFTLANTGMMNLKATVVGTGVRTDQNVPGSPVWTDTGLDVAAGDAIGIRAGGTVCYATNGLCYGPDGEGSAAAGDWTAPGVSKFSLIAKIGDDAPFFVGSTYVGTASSRGRLYLGTNDGLLWYSDNTGSYQTHIEIQGLPTSFQGRPSFSIGSSDATNLNITLDTYYLPAGAFDRNILIRTNDPVHPTQTFRIQGTVVPYVAPARSMTVSPYRPWDQQVVVSEDRHYRELVTFNDTIAVDITEVHPLRVYNDTRQTQLGAGREIAFAEASGGQPTAAANAATSDTKTHNTSDPESSTRTVTVRGTITAVTSDIATGSLQWPLDWSAPFARGMHGQLIGFIHTPVSDPQFLRPIKVYSQDYSRLWGVGNRVLSSRPAIYSMSSTRDGDLFIAKGEFFYANTLFANVNVNLFKNQYFINISGYDNVNFNKKHDKNYINTAEVFVPGDEILIIQMSGPQAGHYEFAIVKEYSRNTIKLKDRLKNNYISNSYSSVQIIRIPHYGIVSGGGTIVAKPWDGKSGGVIAFRAFQVTGVTVDASSQGYYGGYGNGSSQAGCRGESGTQGQSPNGSGGCSRNPNGGGGGAGQLGSPGPHWGSGGGGGYGSPGTSGVGNYRGAGGGVYGDHSLSQLYMGAGGGGGAWGTNPYGGGRNTIQGGDNAGRGGGIVFISANDISSSSFFANGNAGGNSNGAYGGYAGGGGAGGSIKLIGINVSDIIAVAVGGPGGNGTLGNGGNGGVGRIRIEYCNYFSGHTNPPASVARVNFCYGVVSGRVFRDDNGNGVHDAGEPGMGGVTVSLSGVGQTTTDGNGNYSFTANAPANYNVSINPPTGYDCNTPCSVNISLQVDQTTTVNFALRPKASITGKVFHDTNNNREQDGDEPGIAGVMVMLDGTSQTRITAIDGSYSFDQLLPGSYSVSVAVPDGYVNATPTTVLCNLGAGSTCTANFGIVKYTVEKVSGSEHQIRLFLPESFRGGRRYWVQYGRKMVFNAAGQQQAQVKLPQAHYGTVTMDVLLVEPVSPNTFIQLNLDVGCDGSSEWSKNANLAIPTTLSTNNLALGFNRFMAGATPGADGLVTVPLCLSFNVAGRLYLTNLVATPDGISDVSISSADVTLDLTNPIEGDTVNIQATLHNASRYDSGGLTASFYATAPGWGEWYIGSAFVPNVPAGGTAQASISWNTLGFTGDVPVRVVVDPYNRVAETSETNNVATATLTIRTRPDLQVTGIALSNDEPVAGETVTVTLTLHNNGQTTAGAQTVVLYQGNPDASGIVIGAQGLMPLPGGNTTNIAFTWTPVAPGPYRLFARADRNNAVNEYDEGNNDFWQDIYVGLRGPILLDSGSTSDVIYTPERSYGYVDEGQPDVTTGCGNQGYETLRRDPGGRVVYRFDHLLPGHFYHLDVTLYECDGAGRQQSIYVDGNLIAGPEDLSDGRVHRLSLRLDPALYADRRIVVSVEAPGIDGAVVGEMNLHDIDYRYADAGGQADPQYPGGRWASLGRPYGWLEGVLNTAWGTLPYQSVRVNQSGNTLRYRFDGLNLDHRYQLNLTFWQPTGSARIQKVQIDGTDIGLTVNSGDYQVRRVTVDVPTSAYASDGSIIVGIVRTNAATGAFVNEIALEELTAVLPPVADFAASPTQGYAPLTVQFSDRSSGAITSRSWSFGDGGSSTIPNPVHTYNSPGVYTVTLTVSGLGGSHTLTRPNYITVISMPATATVVSVGPPTAQAHPSVPITVAVAISNVTNLGSFQFTLAYSPTLVTVQNITLSEFPGSTGRSFTPVGPSIDNNNGTATFGAFSLGSTPAGPSGSGVLAYIRLLPQAGGTAALILSGVQVANVSGESVQVVTRNGTLFIAACVGDFDGDGDVDILDVQRIAYRWNTHSGSALYEPAYDMDDDGDIDILDVQRVAYRWGTRCGQTTGLEARPMQVQAPAALSVQPNSRTVIAGQIFTVGIVVSDVVDLGSFEFTLAYSPTVVRVVSATLGTFPSSTGRSFASLGPNVDSTAGTVSFGAFSLGTMPQGASGSGTLAVLTLQALAEGESGLRFRSAQVSDRAGSPQPVGDMAEGRVSVVQGQRLLLPVVMKR